MAEFPSDPSSDPAALSEGEVIAFRTRDLAETPPLGDLLDQVEDFLSRFVAYPSEHALVAHTLWVPHTHLISAWDTTPRLAFMSAEKASGKTRALEMLELLVPNPVLSINASPAYLVRRVSAGHATILYDEIDALFGSTKAQEGSVDVRSILNGGYRRGATVGRCVMIGNRVETEELDSFAAVAIAGLRDLPDTLASRAIIIRLRRRAPDEQVEPFTRRKVKPEADVLKRSLEISSEAMAVVAAAAEPDFPASIVDRNAEIWWPLFVVADLAGGKWPKRARAAATHLIKATAEETMTSGVELLAHIYEAFEGADDVPTAVLLERLHNRPESPWKEIRGRQLDDRGLANRLKPYGIKSRNVRAGASGSKVLKGYVTDDFADAWQRYLPAGDERYKRYKRYKVDNQNNYVADVADVADRPHGGDGSLDKCSEAELRAYREKLNGLSERLGACRPQTDGDEFARLHHSKWGLQPRRTGT